MSLEYIYPEYEVIRNVDKCIDCKLCIKECYNDVHNYFKEHSKYITNDEKCVNCQRCVAFCPTKALKIVKSDNTYKKNHLWTTKYMNELYKQANSGGVLLSSMGIKK